MILLEAHFNAAFRASQAACELLDLLPETDLHSQLKNLLNVQFDLFIHMINGHHYGTRDLNKFLDYTEEVKHEVARIKEEL